MTNKMIVYDELWLKKTGAKHLKNIVDEKRANILIGMVKKLLSNCFWQKNTENLIIKIRALVKKHRSNQVFFAFCSHLYKTTCNFWWSVLLGETLIL